MSFYNVELLSGNVLKVGFGDEPASNDKIVAEAVQKAEALREAVIGKGVLRINGAASLPVAIALSHTFAHVVPAVAVFDPKLNAYVVSISHSRDFNIGDLI